MSSSYITKTVQQIIKKSSAYLPRFYAEETRALLKKSKKYSDGIPLPTISQIKNVKLGRSIDLNIAIAIRTVANRYRAQISQAKKGLKEPVK